MRPRFIAAVSPARVLGPVLASAALALLLAGCSRGNADVSQGIPANATFKDGTYSAQGTYRTHVGPEVIDVSLTLQNSIITDATFQGHPSARMSQFFQGQFAGGFKQQVVGKRINEVSLGVVNGSSLTPIGFMDALHKIEAQAVVQ